MRLTLCESQRDVLHACSPFIIIGIVTLALLGLSAVVGGCASSHTKVESHNGFPVVMQCVPGPRVVGEDGKAVGE